jgi:hypothetical protein
MARGLDRTLYCRQQAAECASAAAKTSLPEAREAYLNMERAWLELAPDVKSNEKLAIKDTNEQRYTPAVTRRAIEKSVGPA